MAANNHPDLSMESIAKAEHIDPATTGDNIAAKKAANYVWNGSSWDRMTQPGGSGGGSTQYTDGSSTIAHPIGTIPVFDNAGTITAVSAANPLPTTATITGGGDASAANQTTEITKLTSIDGKLTDVATQTTLALIKAKTDNLDVALSTRTKPSDQQHVIVDSGVTTGLTDTQLRATPVDENLSKVGGSTVSVGEVTDIISGSGLQDVIAVGQYNSTPATLTSTRFTNIQLDSKGNQRGVIRDGAGNNRAAGVTAGNALVVDGSAVTQPVSLATNTPTLQSGSTTAVTQATAANLNATVVGSGTFAVQVTSAPSTAVTNAGTFAVQAAQSGTWNINNISGTVSLPTGASTLSAQTTGNSSLSSIDTKLSGTLTVNQPSPTTAVGFVTTVTTAGTRVQLASNTVAGGVIEADPDNTAGSYIYVGGSSVSSTVWGAKLSPGQSTGISVANTNDVWVDSSANGLKAGFLGS